MESNKGARILVLGATGRTGKHIIRQALKSGFKVRALSRNISKAPKFEEGEVEWVQGDSTDAGTLNKAAEGQSAVLSTVGPSMMGKTTVYSETMRAVLDAMKSKGVKNFVGVSAVWDPSLIPWYQKPIAWMLSGLKDDMLKMEELLQKEGGDVNWTVARPFGLKEKDSTGKYRIGEGQIEPPFKQETYTGDLADFLLKEVFAHEWNRKVVNIGY